MNYFQYLLHHHTFGPWQESWGNQHRFFHVKTLEQSCTQCGQVRLQLLELDCPRKRRTGEYCPTCKPWAERMKDLIDNAEINPILKTTMGKFKTGKFYLQPMEKRNKAVYEYRMDGHTLEEVGKKFGITRARVHAICKRIEEKQSA